MRATVAEWVAKADADWATAQRELAAHETPNFDAVCFHAQQCVEKLMKALLLHVGAAVPRTHDLGELARRLTAAGATCRLPVEDLNFLSRAAVDYRYPGESADLAEAQDAVQIAARLRDTLKPLLA